MGSTDHSSLAFGSATFNLTVTPRPFRKFDSAHTRSDNTLTVYTQLQHAPIERRPMVPTVTQHDVAASPAFRPSYSGPKRAAARAQRHIMASSGAPRPLAGCGRHGITSHMTIAASEQPMDPLATRARASRTAAWKGSSSCAPEARARRETHRSSWRCERLRAEAATDGGEWCEGMVWARKRAIARAYSEAAIAIHDAVDLTVAPSTICEHGPLVVGECERSRLAEHLMVGEFES